MSTLIEPLLSCLSRSLIKLLMSKKQGNPCHPQINPATDPNAVAIKKKKKEEKTRQIITKNSKKVFFVMFKSVPAPPKTKKKKRAKEK
jgi:hypothetical protein